MANVSFKSIRETHRILTSVSTLRDLSCKFLDATTGNYLVVGGQWSTIQCKYVSQATDSAQIFKVTHNQYEILCACWEALFNPIKLETGLPPIITIVVKARRRGGKSYLLYAAHLMTALAKPGSPSRITSKRQWHGVKLIRKIMQFFNFDPDIINWDKKRATLVLCNGSRVSAHAEVNRDADRGDTSGLESYDEGAFLQEETLSAGLPQITDQAGFSLFVSTPKSKSYFDSLAKKQDSKDPLVQQIVRVYSLNPDDNVFVPYLKKMQEYMIHVLTPRAYKEEMLGLVVDDDVKVLPDFDKDLHVTTQGLITLTDYSQYKKDPNVRVNWVPVISKKVFKNKYNRVFKYIVGVDYNKAPTCGTICQYDDQGHIWYIGEVSSNSSIEIFGDMLWEELLNLGCTDPYAEAVIIGDASGEYQGDYYTDRLGGAAHKILREQGWTVKKPVPPPHKKNPLIERRMEVTRSLTKNAAGEIRLHVHPRCKMLIETMDTLNLDKNSKPNKSNKLNHWFDSLSYPCYRIWGTSSGESVYGIKLVHVPHRDEDVDVDKYLSKVTGR